MDAIIIILAFLLLYFFCSMLGKTFNCLHWDEDTEYLYPIRFSFIFIFCMFIFVYFSAKYGSDSKEKEYKVECEK